MSNETIRQLRSKVPWWDWCEHPEKPGEILGRYNTRCGIVVRAEAWEDTVMAWRVIVLGEARMLHEWIDAERYRHSFDEICE